MINILAGRPSGCSGRPRRMPSQLTVQRPVETEGIGLHTAVRSRVRFVPAPADTGIVFRRVDLDNFEIEAHVRNVARVSYATSLMKQGVLLSTTEHVLAALYSCGIDNVYVEIDALELPILDGSAKPFIDLLAQAGIKAIAPSTTLHQGAEAARICRWRSPAGDLPGGRLSRSLLRGFPASGGSSAGNRVEC